MVSSLILAPPLWLFIAVFGAVTLRRWKHKPAFYQGCVMVLGLCLMAVPHGDLWEFGVWVAAAYLVDMVGDDAAPGTFLTASALFYPLSALGFNPWWCQLGANIMGLAALVAISGMGGGILANYRYNRDPGFDFMGRVWIRGLSARKVGNS